MQFFGKCEGRLLAALCLAVGLSGFASAQTPTAKSLARVVDAHYNHLRSLQATFHEQYQGMGMDRTETGTLTLRKPGRMRWIYERPAGKTFILDGHDAYSYTVGDPQAQRIPAKQLDDLRSPLRFLLGHTQLEKELDGLTLTPAGSLYSLAGVPRGMSQRVRSISLTVNASGQIRTLRLEQTNGDATSFTFSDIRENVPTADGDFIFKAPPGVSIVTGTPPI